MFSVSGFIITPKFTNTTIITIVLLKEPFFSHRFTVISQLDKLNNLGRKLSNLKEDIEAGSTFIKTLQASIYFL